MKCGLDKQEGGITLTTREKHMYTKAVQALGRIAGHRFIQKNMILLEGGIAYDEFLRQNIVDYVMFEDCKTGKQYQCYYKKNTGVVVNEYVPNKL